MPYTASATTSADPSALIEAIQAGCRLTPSMKNSTAIGIEAATADSPRLPAIGS
jgi:hypothetical protein